MCSVNISGGVVSIFDPRSFEIDWRDVPGFSKYQASNTGLVRHKRLNRICDLYEVPTSVGSYLRASALSDDGKHRAKEAHHLVCLAFHGLPPDDARYEVNHKDGNKHNNLETNLEWKTRGQNLIHAYQEGLRSENRRFRVHDRVDHETTDYHSLAELGRGLNLTKSESWRVVVDHTENKFRGRYTFEFVDPERTKPNNFPWRKDIKAFDYRNKRLLIAEDSGTMELLTGVKRSTILWNLRNGSAALVKGCVFLYVGSHLEFPNYSGEQVEASLTGISGNGIRVTDTLSNTTVVYSSVGNFAKRIGVKHPNEVWRAINKTQGRYKHYLIEKLL